MEFIVFIFYIRKFIEKIACILVLVIYCSNRMNETKKKCKKHNGDYDRS